MSTLPFSQACENNKDLILEILSRVFADSTRVLEIGSGTGQHAAHFAANLAHLDWQPTELPQHLPVTMPRVEAYPGENLRPVQVLDVLDRPWTLPAADALFTANTLHIMPFTAVEALFAELESWAGPGTVLAIYGPFNYGGQYTSESNARFDLWLAERDPASAIRDFEAVDALAQSAGFSLLEDNAMPANNRLLVWRK